MILRRTHCIGQGISGHTKHQRMTTRTAVSPIMKTRVIWLTHSPRIAIFVRMVFLTSHPLTQVAIMRTRKAVSYNDIHHVSPLPTTPSVNFLVSILSFLKMPENFKPAGFTATCYTVTLFLYLQFAALCVTALILAILLRAHLGGTCFN